MIVISSLINFYNMLTFLLTEEVIDFVKRLQDIKLTEFPQDTTFEAQLSKPNVPVQWYKNDKPITKGPKYDIIADGPVHKLIIKDASTEDEATYSIAAKSNKSAGKLIVQGLSRNNFNNFFQYFN